MRVSGSIRTTPGLENSASLLMHLGWLLRGEGPSCSPVHPAPRRWGITGPFLPPVTQPVRSQLPAHREGCSTELGLEVWPFLKWRSQLMDRKWFSPHETSSPAWSRGRLTPLAQTVVFRAQRARTPRAAGLGANAAPQGPLHSESYGPEARLSASASGPQDREAFPGVVPVG